jgi:hypothetical protein
VVLQKQRWLYEALNNELYLCELDQMVEMQPYVQVLRARHADFTGDALPWMARLVAPTHGRCEQYTPLVRVDVLAS